MHQHQEEINNKQCCWCHSIGDLSLDQHWWDELVCRLLALQLFHNCQGKLKGCSRAPAGDQLTINYNPAFTVLVVAWAEESEKNTNFTHIHLKKTSVS